MSEPLAFPCPVTALGLPDPVLTARASGRQVVEVTYGGAPAWLVTGHALAREVLSQSDRFSNTPDPDLVGGRANLAVLDPPEHTRMRRLVAAALTPRRLRSLVPQIEEIVDRRVSAMLAQGPPVDAVSMLARPLPSEVIALMLDVPVGDGAQLAEWSSAFTSMSALSPDEVMAVVAALTDYLERLTSDSGPFESEDLVSRLSAARVGADTLTVEELRSTLALLVVAGTETTSKAITRGLLVLLTTEWWQRFVDGTVPVADVVEESLRHQTPHDTGLFRWARRETELDDVLVPVGGMVLVSLQLANHDPAVFTDPADFLPGGDRPAHLAFGHGVHFCLGAALARAELTCVLDALVRRTPTLRLAADPDDLCWSVGSMLNAPESLPVRW